METKRINIKSGIIGGLIGGVVFGMMMTMRGMMPLVATMVGSESVVVGWILHLLISVGTGGAFGALFKNVVKNYGSAAGYGVLYGVIWWVLGALILLPVILGMGLQFANMFDGQHLVMLMGHMVFGVLLGLGAYWYTTRK